MKKLFLLLFSVGNLCACTSFFPTTDPLPAKDASWKNLVGTWKFNKCRGNEIQPAWISVETIEEGGVEGLKIQKWNRSETRGQQLPEQVYRVFPRTLKQAQIKAHDLSDKMPIEGNTVHTIADNRVVVSYQWQPAVDDRTDDGHGRWLGSGIGNYFITDQGDLVFKRKGITYMPERAQQSLETSANMVNWESHCFYTRVPRPHQLLSFSETVPKETLKN